MKYLFLIYIFISCTPNITMQPIKQERYIKKQIIVVDSIQKIFNESKRKSDSIQAVYDKVYEF
jgi:hypothetical protein